MNDVVRWLESPEGEAWSYMSHRPSVNALAMIKEQSDAEKRVVLWSAFNPWGCGWKLAKPLVTPDFRNAAF